MTALTAIWKYRFSVALVIIAGLLALWRTTDAKLDQCGRENKTWVKTSRVQEGSIVTLQDALDRKNAELDARGREAAAAKAREQATLQEMDFKARGMQSRIDTLNRIAANQNSVCGVSDELRGALEGL